MVREVRPSATLAPESAEILREVLPSLADETIAAIAVEVPDYARPMEGAFGQLVRLGVEVALNRFVDLLAGKPIDAAGPRDTYVNLGRGEFHSGRSLDALLSAYRVGARLAWRRFVEVGTKGGLPPETLYDLGEAMFSYIDEISAESAEGYAEEQSAAAGEAQRRRRALVRLLAQEPPPSQEAVRTAAQAAGWVLPRRVAAIVAAEADQPAGLAAAHGEAGPNEEIVDTIAARLARRLGAGAVGAAVGGLAVVMLGDPDGPGRRRELLAALAGERAALGPTVPWPEAAASLRRAAHAFRLGAQGRLPGALSPAGQSAPAAAGQGAHSAAGQPAPSPADQGAPSAAGQTSPSTAVESLIVAEEHLAALLLAAEPALAADLARTRLAPLDGLAGQARERLVGTLRAWLDRPGQVQAVAAALGVHPQTVRYRLKQLRELFGARLEDPEARFELSLALRAAEGIRYS